MTKDSNKILSKTKSTQKKKSHIKKREKNSRTTQKTLTSNRQVRSSRKSYFLLFVVKQKKKLKKGLLQCNRYAYRCSTLIRSSATHRSSYHESFSKWNAHCSSISSIYFQTKQTEKMNIYRKKKFTKNCKLYLAAEAAQTERWNEDVKRNIKERFLCFTPKLNKSQMQHKPKKTKRVVSHPYNSWIAVFSTLDWPSKFVLCYIVALT